MHKNGKVMRVATFVVFTKDAEAFFQAKAFCEHQGMPITYLFIS